MWTNILSPHWLSIATKVCVVHPVSRQGVEQRYGFSCVALMWICKPDSAAEPSTFHKDLNFLVLFNKITVTLWKFCSGLQSMVQNKKTHASRQVTEEYFTSVTKPIAWQKHKAIVRTIINMHLPSICFHCVTQTCFVLSKSIYVFAARFIMLQMCCQTDEWDSRSSYNVFCVFAYIFSKGSFTDCSHYSLLTDVCM